MPLPKPDPVAMTQALVRCPSVTPVEGGALDYLQSMLEPAGFACHRLVFSDAGTADVDNLFARLGSGRPHLCFAGHADVVPVGEASLWTHPPFSGAVHGGFLHGRGAVDMKGSIACFLAAALDLLVDPAMLHQGSVSFLITGDEEAAAVNGTVKVLQWMAANGHTPDHCLVGEPSNSEAIGDAIKIGRRGSLNGRVAVTGKQGHAAYPQLAANPLRGLVKICDAWQQLVLDEGTAHFAPSNLEVVSVDTDNAAYNVIPAKAEARINVRFNDTFTAASLEALLRQTAEAAVGGGKLALDMVFSGNAEAFVSTPGPLVETLTGAVAEVTGRQPELTTSGGTSDARFVKDFCPVVEFGLVNRTIHAVDERVPVSDLELLTKVYRRFIERYFAAASGG
mgnify:CR=1 FL=1